MSNKSTSQVLLPGFRSNVPGVPEEITKVAWLMPLSVKEGSSFDLDFLPFLLFDKVLIEKDTFDFLSLSPKIYHNRISKTLVRLKREGRIEVVDTRPIVEQNRKQIIHASRLLATNPAEWAPHIIESVTGWWNLESLHRKALGSEFNRDVWRSEYGTYIFLRSRGIETGGEFQKEADRIESLLRHPVNLDNTDYETLQEVVTPTIAYVQKNLHLSQVLGVPFLDLDFTTSLYLNAIRHGIEDSVVTANRSANMRIALASRMFKAPLANLRPNSAEHAMRILEDKRFLSFRIYLERILSEQEKFDEDEILAASNRLNEQLADFTRRITGVRVIRCVQRNLFLPVLLNPTRESIHDKQHPWLAALVQASIA